MLNRFLNRFRSAAVSKTSRSRAQPSRVPRLVLLSPSHSRAPCAPLILFFALSLSVAHGQGLTWPTNQMLPAFSKPAAVLDAIDVSSSTGPEVDLFASLEGIVN